VTRQNADEPGNDVLSDQLREVVRELRVDDEEQDGRTFRALVEQRLGAVEATMSRLMVRQDQVLFGIVLLFVGGLVSLVLRGG
jgi:hypothetical protein